MPEPKPSGKKLLGLNKWAWVGIVALGVVVFLYFRHQSNAAAAATGNAPQADASPVDTAALGGTPPSTDGGAAFSPDDSQLLADMQNMLTQSLQQFGSQLPALTGAGVTPDAPVGSVPVGTTAGGSPVYQNPNGQAFTVTQTGYAQPAYIGPSGGYVSPTTYAGIGATPQPITSVASTAPISSTQTTQIGGPSQVAPPVPFGGTGVDWQAAVASVANAPIPGGTVRTTRFAS